MHIDIQHFDRQFNVCLSSAQGKEPFLTIKGARIVEGKNGPFVSWPAKKLDSGKYWNYAYGSEAFNQAVLEKAQATMPKADTRTHAERKRPTRDDDVPF